MTEYADPDLETVAPLPPLAPETSGAEAPPPAPERGRLVALICALVVVSLVIGFSSATLILDARTKNNAVAIAPTPTIPTTPGATTPGATTPGSTAPTVPADPDESVLDGLIVRQADVPSVNLVVLLDHGADLTAATLDLCNGTYASEKLRTARRQVGLADAQGNLDLSTEAILYRAPANGAQAFAELRSVVAHCPSTPVPSPVGEATVTTKFGPAPDEAWPRTPSVDRLAFDFTTTDGTGTTSHSVAVYLRRGRVLMGIYFAQPSGVQVPVDAKTTMAGIVSVFEARMAKVPASVVSG